MIQTGISFSGQHSFRDFGLILGKVEIPPASPKETFVNIPGADGSVDLTEALGEVKYSDRTGAKFTFYMNPAGDLSEDAWEAKKTEICNALNGRRLDIIIDKDPDYYWQGRCTVSEHSSSKKLRKFVVGARLAPYKLKLEATTVDVDLTEISQDVILPNGRKTVFPYVYCTGSAKIIGDGVELNISSGQQQIPIALKFGNNALSVSGSGRLSFRYREGDL